MSAIRVLIILGLLVAGMTAADISTFGGGRPAHRVHDPDSWLPEPERKGLVRELESINESAGIDILVAVVANLEGHAPQTLADELAKRWGYHGGRAVVLWVPDNPESPWITVSGLIRSEIPAPRLESIIERAKQRGRADAAVHGGVQKAVKSLGDDLRFAGGQAARGNQPPPKFAPPKARDVLFMIFLNMNKLAAALVIGTAFFLFLVIWGIKAWHTARVALTPKNFPEVSWKPRFGAPHAGIVYTYSRKQRAHRK